MAKRKTKPTATKPTEDAPRPRLPKLTLTNWPEKLITNGRPLIGYRPTWAMNFVQRHEEYDDLIACRDYSGDEATRVRHRFPSDWFLPARAVIEWKSYWFPLVPTAEAVRQWEDWLTTLASNGSGACDSTETARRLYANLDNDRALLRQHCPELFVNPAPAPHPPAVLPAAQPFIPTPLQERILEELHQRALTLDVLTKKLRTTEGKQKLRADRSRVYRNGLKELKTHGKVKNNRRVGGYYRPDAPPPKYADLLKQQEA